MTQPTGFAKNNSAGKIIFRQGNYHPSYWKSLKEDGWFPVFVGSWIGDDENPQPVND